MTTKAKAKISASKALTRTASAHELAEEVDGPTLALLRGVLEEERYQLLMTPPPAHAIRKRPDGYDYLPHGYVTKTLNEIFGFDWDHRLLPMFKGNIYEYVPADEANLPTKNPCVVVFGELTVRVHTFGKNGKPELVATVTKSGFGGSEIRKKMERADAIKAAASDSRKVCAAQFGPRLGLTLYWDDDTRLKEYEESQNQNGQALNVQIEEYLKQHPEIEAMPTALRNLELAGLLDRRPDEIAQVLK